MKSNAEIGCQIAAAVEDNPGRVSGTWHERRGTLTQLVPLGENVLMETMTELAPRLMSTGLEVAAKKMEPLTETLFEKADGLV